MLFSYKLMIKAWIGFRLNLFPAVTLSNYFLLASCNFTVPYVFGLFVCLFILFGVWAWLFWGFVWFGFFIQVFLGAVFIWVIFICLLGFCLGFLCEFFLGFVMIFGLVFGLIFGYYLEGLQNKYLETFVALKHLEEIKSLQTPSGKQNTPCANSFPLWQVFMVISNCITWKTPWSTFPV